MIKNFFRKFFTLVFARIVARQIDKDIKVCPTNNGSYFEFARNIVWINTQDLDDGGFLRHMRKIHRFKYTYDYSLMVITVLHELGHFCTWDEVEDDINTRIMCSMITEEDAKNVNIQNAYFNIPTEYAATDWAIHYIIKHKNFCKIFSLLTR